MTKNIELYIVEDHNNILEPLYNNIGRKKLPFNGMILLHFDSHSDLSSPSQLDAVDSFNKHLVFDLTSIENWILPTLYNSHFNHVIWLKPFWTKESFQNHSEFCIGRSLTTGKICVNSVDNYFLSECIYEPLSNMDNSKLVQLTVITIEESLLDLTKNEIIEKLTKIIEDVNNLLLNSPNGYILDIDLDFFSTQNPFLKSIPSQCWDLMQKLYQFIPPKDLCLESVLSCVEYRKNQLNYLKEILNNRDAFHFQGTNIHICEDVRKLVTGLSPTDSVDLEWIHEIGSGIDDCALPHHVSTPSQIFGLMQAMECILEGLSLPPLAITVARSSCDDYCPVDQVELIQDLLLKTLNQIYDHKIHINLLYNK